MKIDVSKIDGYAEMSAEDKLAALEAYDVPDPDYSGYVKKDVFDKTASELAGIKKEMREKMSEEEASKLKDAEEKKSLQENYDKLLREVSIFKNKSKLLSLGYEEKLANDTAEAMADGDIEKVFVNQKKHLDSFEKKVRAEVLNDTPKPTGDGDSKTMTLDSLRKMTSEERYKYSVDHPEEYKELYGGKE